MMKGSFGRQFDDKKHRRGGFCHTEKATQRGSNYEHCSDVYEIPCICSKEYIGETKAMLEEMQLRENKDASTRCLTDKRALADYARHPIKTKI